MQTKNAQTLKQRLLLKVVTRWAPLSSRNVFSNHSNTNVFLQDELQLPHAKRDVDICFLEVDSARSIRRLLPPLTPSALVVFHLSKGTTNIHSIITEIDRLNLKIELRLYYGLFSILFGALRKIPVLHHIPKWLDTFELQLHPHVPLISGTGIFMVARRMEALESPTKDLSIVIPAYNEEKRIAQTLKDLHRFLVSSKAKHEVLVVDDGSSDQTALVVKRALKTARVIRLYRNFGKGGAVKEGVRHALGAKILIVDADGATPIVELKKLQSELDLGYDIAIGSRYLKASRVIVKQNIVRRIVSRVGNFLIRSLLALPYKDTQCGFKLFQYLPAKLLFKDLRNLRFGYDFEILKTASQMDFTVSEIPVEWHDKTGSKIGARNTFHVLWELLWLRFGYFIKFSLVGALNTIIDFAVHNSLILAFGRGDATRQVTYMVTGFITANLISFVFNSGFTFQRRGSYIRFFLISLITLALSSLVFYALNEIFNQQNSILVANILKLSTTVISLITNYFGYKIFVFRYRP